MTSININNLPISSYPSITRQFVAQQPSGNSADPIFAVYAAAAGSACEVVLGRNERVRDRLDRIAMKSDTGWQGVGGVVDQARLLRAELHGRISSLVKHSISAEQRQGDQIRAGEEWSHSEWYEMLAGLIGRVDQEWLSKYEDLLKFYTGLLGEIADILSHLSEYTSMPDENSTEMNTALVREQLSQLIEKYMFTDVATFGSAEEATAFLKELGLDGAFEVIGSSIRPSGSYMNPLIQLKNHFPDKNPKLWDNLEYNAWLQGKDSLYEQIQSVGRNLAELNSRAMQRFDNMVKILSSSIEGLGQADKNIVNNLI